ncbi:MAG TPA: AraC family transcriptional regulator [Cyclobacteriaceae bacterium]|nr:AraC family transcriptional regulator [Cyclobacteriaceae bacterium]
MIIKDYSIMDSFALKAIENTLAVHARNISNTLRLFGQQDKRLSYFISDGANIAMYPKEAFKADYYIYAICLSGTATLSLKGEKLNLKVDDFFAAIPSTTIQVFEHSKNFKVKVLLFEKAFLLKNISDTRQLDQLGFFNYDTVAHVHLTRQEAVQLKQKLDNIGERSETSGIFHSTIMQSLIINLLFETAEVYYRYLGKTKKKVLNNEEFLFLKFMQLVRAHFKEERQLEFYAGKLFISNKYLIEVCRAVAGKTPGTLIAEAVLAEAKLLLALPHHNISTVSAELQYSSVAAFSKFFRKHTGKAPTVFKQDYTLP